jgi:malonyl CoA-acyl carrier protein transacylase/phosphopantetheinyl transferase
MAMVAKDTEDLAAKIEQALKRLKGNAGERWATRNGLVYSSRPLEGKLAFMFPGEGSQYLGMLEDLALYFDEVRSWFDFWRGLYDDPPGESRTDIIFPPRSELTEQRRQVLEKRIHDMDVGSETVFVGGQAMYSLLESLGVRPDAMVGHSTGESSALAASGAMAYDNLEQLADFIRRLNQVYRGVLAEGKIPTGVLLSVGALPQSVIEEQLAALNKEIVIAMDNCSNQLVLFGDQASIDALQKSLGAAGGICMPLPFDRGYHTVHFSAMSKAFLDYYKHIGLKTPRVPLYSCASADLFPDDEDRARKLAAGQWSLKVRFRETVAQMYRKGIRYFVEVGPAGNLCAFVHDILSGKEYLAVAGNLRRKNSVEQLLILLAHLYANGKDLKLEKLFSSRLAVVPDPEKVPKESPERMPLLDNTMPVIHLNDADRADLQAMLLQREATEPETRQSGEAPDSKPRFHPSDALEASNADEQVMAEYFNLMRDFIDQQRRVLELSGMNAETQPHEAAPLYESAPFLSSLTESDEQHLEGTCRLCVYEDNFLRDHILSGAVSEIDPDLLGLSCVPLMVSLEIMAEACALLAGSTDVRVIENVKASAWIALDEGELTLDVRAEVLDPAARKIRAYLTHEGVLAVTADFAFAGDWHAGALPALTEKQHLRWEDDELYDIGMFHGPIFQSIRRIGGWNDQGIDADLSSVSLEGFFESSTTPKLVLNPVLLDAIGQLSAYWIAQQVGTDFNCFPSTIERIELYRPCPQNMAGMTLRARQQPLDPAAENIDAPRLWQFECLDKEGQPLFRVSNLVNIYFAVPNRFYVIRRDPLNGWLGHPAKTDPNQNITLWQLPGLTEEFCSQSSGIFLRILAQIFLSFEERVEWRKLTINNRRKREWLLGRACVKEAVRYWIFQQTGTLLYSSDIVVLHDEMGAPYVDGWWNGDLLQAPQVSLSHTAQLSLAAVTAPHHPVGVDVEHIGGVKNSDLLEGSLSETERAALHGLNGNDVSEKVLRMWCAKEAAAKYLGTGLKGRPDEFEVSFLDDSGKRVLVTHKQKMVEVAVDCDNNSIIALASAHSA